MQGQREVGMAQMHQGLAAVLATGQELARPFCLVLLAEALTACEATGRGDGLAEAYRLQGALLLRQAAPDVAQAEACFQQVLAIARRQQAKSWEWRAAMSLSRLNRSASSGNNLSAIWIVTPVKLPRHIIRSLPLGSFPLLLVAWPVWRYALSHQLLTPFPYETG